MRNNRTVAALIIGTLGGLFSGLFGVGGGIVMVPLLILLLGLDERRATSASLAAIVIIASVGAFTQSGYGQLHLLEGLAIGLPAIGGVVAGTSLQQRIPAQRVSLLFGLLMFVVAALMISGLTGADSTAATDNHGQAISLGRIAAALPIGFLAGVISGLLGVGGGTLFVPGLAIILGLDHVAAEATSLLAIIPVAVVGSVKQWRYGNLDLRLAVSMGLLAIPSAALGVVIVNHIPPRAAQLSFALLSIYVGYKLLLKGLKRATPDIQ